MVIFFYLQFGSPKQETLMFRKLETLLSIYMGFPGDAVVKNPPTNGRDVGSVPWVGRSSGGGNDNPCHYSCQDDPVDRGASQATVHGATKSQT